MNNEQSKTVLLQSKVNGDVYRVIGLKPEGVELKNLSSGKDGVFPTGVAKENLAIPVKLNLLIQYRPDVAELIEQLQLSVI